MWGDRVSLGVGVMLIVGEGAALSLGNDVRITHYTVIGVEDSVSIEDRQ